MAGYASSCLSSSTPASTSRGSPTGASVCSSAAAAASSRRQVLAPPISYLCRRPPSSAVAIESRSRHCFSSLSYYRVSLSLNSVPEITSSGLVSVAVGCKSLSDIFLINCEKLVSVERLEYLGSNGILEEFVVKNCTLVSQYDLLKFGPGLLKLRKFDFVLLCHGSDRTSQTSMETFIL